MVRPFQGVSLAVIGLVLVGACPSAALAQDDEEAGFRAIFNGRDLTGWEGAQGLWSVEDGAITGRTTPETRLRENSFLIWRDGLVDDFVLRLRYRIVNGNSGIQYRSEDRGRFVVGGYQADIDSADNYSGILYEERGRGILATRGQSVRIDEKNERSIAGSLGDAAALQRDIKKEDWNDYEIVARGNRIEHRINGKTMVEVVDGSKEHAKREGILALQIHVGPPMTVQFKDVRIKRLPLEDEKKIVLVAGRPSHGPGDHEHNAGVELLAKCLDAQPKTRAQTYLNGWPRDP
ncbi:MAG TPA: DUF1080 domain-containing protein, partial [Planctomycetota bacterium]|nr:DUF1080 domain-containing protein [Planctomycetota bacterium]